MSNAVVLKKSKLIDTLSAGKKIAATIGITGLQPFYVWYSSQRKLCCIVPREIMEQTN